MVIETDRIASCKRIDGRWVVEVVVPDWVLDDIVRDYNSTLGKASLQLITTRREDLGSGDWAGATFVETETVEFELNLIKGKP